MQAIVLEAIATFFLVFVVFGTAVDPRGPKVGGFAIGLTVTAGILGIGPLTGGSMNPARSFGPAVVTHIFEGQIVYWVGPLLGGIVAALLYDRLFLTRRVGAGRSRRRTTDRPDRVRRQPASIFRLMTTLRSSRRQPPASIAVAGA